jgi:hypothetical protein
VELTAMSEPDALAAVLIKLSEQADRLTALADQVTGLRMRLDALDPADGQETVLYLPGPTPPFWRLDPSEREAPIARLRDWVDQVYRPGYGHLADTLGACWEQHPLCVYTLDWLSELWSVLYLQPMRTSGTLAGQAEWQTRLLSAAAEQLSRETSRCAHAAGRRTHSQGAANRSWPGSPIPR